MRGEREASGNAVSRSRSQAGTLCTDARVCAAAPRPRPRCEGEFVGCCCCCCCCFCWRQRAAPGPSGLRRHRRGGGGDGRRRLRLRRASPGQPAGKAGGARGRALGRRAGHTRRPRTVEEVLCPEHVGNLHAVVGRRGRGGVGRERLQLLRRPCPCPQPCSQANPRVGLCPHPCARVSPTAPGEGCRAFLICACALHSLHSRPFARRQPDRSASSAASPPPPPAACGGGMLRARHTRLAPSPVGVTVRGPASLLST